MSRFTFVLVFSLLFTWAVEAEARSVYLNGVDISSVRDMTFKNAEVTIDKDGTVRITAPRYEVQVKEDAAKEGAAQPTGAAAFKNDKGGPNPALSKRYYLVTQPSAKHAGRHTFTVTVNGTKRRVIKAGAPQLIIEISKWLKKGTNEIIIVAKRPPADTSTGSSSQTSLLIGVGHEENKIVKIDAIEARVTARDSELSDKKKQFQLIAD
jgi:hypothetical protein